jgi:hypothetical protein
VQRWGREVLPQAEAEVTERRQIRDAAMATVGQTADPQTDAAIKLVAWLSRGLLRPAPDDFAMLRLVLLALLPQIGGILLMVAKFRTTGGLALQLPFAMSSESMGDHDSGSDDWWCVG